MSGGFSDLFDAADDALDFATFSCPWCGEPGETLIDACELDGTESAEWIEDCAVCCSPIVLSVRRDGGRLILSADAEGR
ncbi:MAG: CPXCG motif-containing cysteine-rich protein [Thioalkalivibrionaceae bacterium]